MYDCCYDYCCIVGETGPTGPAGPSSELSGIQLQLVGSANGIIQVNQPVIFDSTINVQSPTIGYNPTNGEFTINSAGNYFVSWWVASEGSDMNNLLQFSVVANTLGNASGDTPLVTGQVSGTALISATSTPTLLQLRNTSANNITLARTPVQANIVILQVSS